MTHTLIFVHGLGDSGRSMLVLIEEGFIKVKDNIRIILPTAPKRHVTKINKETWSWYDINELDFTQPERYNETQITASVSYL